MTSESHKNDSGSFLSHLNGLKQQDWLGVRQWWPDYLFHFTDVKNVVSILNEGFLLSRDELKRRDLGWEDAASTEIIERTDTYITDYVRFYFRPLTPTAYQNEGFRPKPNLFQTAHCPVPIYLLFDHRALITLEKTMFSNGSLARKNYAVFRSANDFRQLDFKKIYHNQWFTEKDKQEIVNSRHAEVIHPKSVSLKYLRYICCRSQAEYETLRNLLSPVIWNKWRPLVRARNPHLLYNLKWLHVKEATLTKRLIALEFNTPTAEYDYGPYEMRVDIYDLRSSNKFFYQSSFENIVDQLPTRRLELQLDDTRLIDYRVILTIDENLAYSGIYTDDRSPF